LPYLVLGFLVAKGFPLSEVGEEVKEPVGSKTSGDGLVTGLGQIMYVRVEIAGDHNIGVAIEAVEGFLEVRKRIEGGRREVSPNKWHPPVAGYN
jgi:hypothetical protein